jgi:hypothetical protein
LTPKFPAPDWFGSRRRWPLSKVLAWEAMVAGNPPPPPLSPADEQHLTAQQVQKRLNVSDMWLWRHSAPQKSQKAARGRAAS